MSEVDFRLPFNPHSDSLLSVMMGCCGWHHFGKEPMSVSIQSSDFQEVNEQSVHFSSDSLCHYYKDKVLLQWSVMCNCCKNDNFHLFYCRKMTFFFVTEYRTYM